MTTVILPVIHLFIYGLTQQSNGQLRIKRAELEEDNKETKDEKRKTQDKTEMKHYG
jgi:hypothetical protein